MAPSPFTHFGISSAQLRQDPSAEEVTPSSELSGAWAGGAGATEWRVGCVCQARERPPGAVPRARTREGRPQPRLPSLPGPLLAAAQTALMGLSHSCMDGHEVNDR